MAQWYCELPFIEALKLRQPRDLTQPAENPNAWYLDPYVTGLLGPYGVLTISVRFPRAHLAAVVDALRTAAAAGFGAGDRLGDKP
jgi:hypothetical protein